MFIHITNFLHHADIKWPRAILWLTLLLMTGCWMTTLQAQNKYGFDHDETTFPLDYVHARVSCDSCHNQGIFMGTPRQCHACHSRSGRIQASAPSPRHIRTTEDCEYCHSAGNWENVIRVDHFAVSGSCESCHNGVIATGKNAEHIQSHEICDDCHRPFSWQDAVYDHNNVTNNCYRCHNDIIAEGKNPEHILTSNDCEDCHRSISWIPVLRVDHDAVMGTCYSCHNGVIASGKNDEHFTTGAECDLCHSTLGWTPATFDHSEVSGNCTSCHDGNTATGTPDGHFMSTEECDYCHNTTNWETLMFVHQSATYPGDHRNKLECTACHASNTELVSWSDPAYQPDCAGCHAGDYEQDEQEKEGGGTYTVSELRDCSGSCHESSEHRVSDGDWD